MISNFIIFVIICSINFAVCLFTKIIYYEIQYRVESTIIKPILTFIILSCAGTLMAGLIWWTYPNFDWIQFLLMLVNPYSIFLVYKFCLGFSFSERQKLYNDPQNCVFGKFLARSYYVGYLKIILPQYIDRVKQYESKQGVKISGGKILLLVPRSCNMRGTLDGLDYKDDLEFCEDRENAFGIVHTRAGNVDRKYTVPVYCLPPENNGYDCKPIYVNVVQANNLTGLKEQRNNGMPDFLFNEQVDLYVKCLEEILFNEGWCNLVKIIPYCDINDKGEMVPILNVLRKELILADIH